MLRFVEDGTPVHDGLDDWDCRATADDMMDFLDQQNTPAEIASACVHVFGYYRSSGGNPLHTFKRVITGVHRRLSRI